MKDVYIIGAKGIGQYGGFETFVQKLIENNNTVRYHVACKANGEGSMSLNHIDIEMVNSNTFKYHNTECYLINVFEVGAAQAVFYDLAAIKRCIKEIRINNIEKPIVYVLACRIGPFFNHYVRKIHELGGKVIINPDGHEWKRAKWSSLIKKYWKLSEKMMVQCADLVICDSINIEKYIKNEYKRINPNTTYIPYGSDVSVSVLNDDDKLFVDWLKTYNLKSGEYYLSVGRFVPENNFEIMIREFINCNSSKDYVLITNTNEKLMKQLKKRISHINDSRIKFVGTVYNHELLKKIRENAFAYLHGHEVGGTNPSLLESLSSTKLNLLYDVCFNREVAEDSAIYWNKDKNNLSNTINYVETIDEKSIENYRIKAKKRVINNYSWKMVCDEYCYLFNKCYDNI